MPVTLREGDRSLGSALSWETPQPMQPFPEKSPFAGLTPEIVGRVVEKFVMQLEAQLADRDVTIELSEPAKAWLVQHGYDEQMGARPMARVIQEHIKKPLADEVLFGQLKHGGHVNVVLVKDEGVAGVELEKIGFEFVEGPVTPKPEMRPATVR